MTEVQNYSYHCHTNFSDGKCSIAEMVRRAKEIGFKELGITDHLIVHKNIKQSKSFRINSYMQKENHIYNRDFASVLPEFQKHCEEIRQVAKKENFKIHIGFEVDFFTYNGWFEELCDFLKKLDFDYLISGNHFLFDESGEEVINLTDALKMNLNTTTCEDYLNRHFQTMVKAMDTGIFSFLAHIDYARRLGDDVCGPQMFLPAKTAVLDVLKKQNKGIEISTKGLRKINDFYPSENILKEIKVRDLPIVISDDAHQTEELGYQFLQAEKCLDTFGLRNRIKF